MSALQKISNRQNPVIPMSLRLLKKGGLHEFKFFLKKCNRQNPWESKGSEVFGL